MPKKPEDWLEVASPPAKTRGIFKLFLGYAPGVGKTFSMLSEAIRRHSRGEDVVIGVVESHGRKGVRYGGAFFAKWSSAGYSSPARNPATN